MKNARVCQADVGAIAARRILREKHEIVVRHLAQGETSSLPLDPIPLPFCNKIWFDVDLSTGLPIFQARRDIFFP